MARVSINCGNKGRIYWCDQGFEGRYSQKIKKFLKKVVKGYARVSMQLSQAQPFGFPFSRCYNERTQAGVLIPVFRCLSPSKWVLPELPINRRNQNVGFIDYVVDGGDIFYLIELKFVPLNIYGTFYNEQTIQNGMNQILQISQRDLNYFNPAVRIFFSYPPCITKISMKNSSSKSIVKKIPVTADVPGLEMKLTVALRVSGAAWPLSAHAGGFPSTGNMWKMIARKNFIQWSIFTD